MKARTVRLAHALYCYTYTADAFFHEGRDRSSGHSSGLGKYLWFRACVLAAALCDDEEPDIMDLPARPNA